MPPSVFQPPTLAVVRREERFGTLDAEDKT
jgi:hypothetical protein